MRFFINQRREKLNFDFRFLKSDSQKMLIFILIW